VRAGLLEAKILEQQQPQRAIMVLENIALRRPDFIAVILPALRRNYILAGDLAGLHRYLEEFLAQRKSTAAILCLVDDLYEQGHVHQAGQLLANELQQHPTLLGMNRLLEISLEASTDEARRNLLSLRDVARQAREHKPAYRCDKCGFAGQQLHWQCPNCKSWGSIAPILGIDGD
jgi:lipopolysaccharide biosynthesis regulator YciM